MRFRFCGELDCPDWVLAEIMTLSRITSVKMKLFCQQVINNLLGGNIDYSKVEKFTSDARYDSSDIKATIVAVDFIFSSAGKYGVDGETLSNELQQLGLPKELATSLCKVYSDKIEALQVVLREKSMRISKLKSIDWRVDYVLGSSRLDNANPVEVQLMVSKTTTESHKLENINFTVSEEKFSVLLAEMRNIHKVMENSL